MQLPSIIKQWEKLYENNLDLSAPISTDFQLNLQATYEFPDTRMRNLTLNTASINTIRVTTEKKILTFFIIQYSHVNCQVTPIEFILDGGIEDYQERKCLFSHEIDEIHGKPFYRASIPKYYRRLPSDIGYLEIWIVKKP